MTDVFVAVKGQLTDPSKHALRKAGVVVVEVDDLSKCQFIRATETVSSDDMLYAAMKALRTTGDGYNKGHYQREQFAVAYGQLVEQAFYDRQPKPSAS